MKNFDVNLRYICTPEDEHFLAPNSADTIEDEINSIRSHLYWMPLAKGKSGEFPTSSKNTSFRPTEFGHYNRIDCQQHKILNPAYLFMLNMLFDPEKLVIIHTYQYMSELLVTGDLG